MSPPFFTRFRNRLSGGQATIQASKPSAEEALLQEAQDKDMLEKAVCKAITILAQTQLLDMY